MKQHQYTKNIKYIIKQALREDIGDGDITTRLLIPANKNSIAHIIAKQSGVLAGRDIVYQVFKSIDPRVKINFRVKEGEKFSKGKIIAELKGNTRALLSGERTALNILCRLSGIATLTRKFVEAVAHTKAKILDTRKTTPNLRILEKYAVRMGGGTNHRFGLYDMILIKDNHIQAAGSITNAIMRTRKNNSKMLIEVETKNLSEVKESLQLKVPIIMFDNMNLKQIREAVKLAKGKPRPSKVKWQKDYKKYRAIQEGLGKAKLEVSGGVNLRNIRKIAKTGVDYISVGALTHSAQIIDMSMKIDN